MKLIWSDLLQSKYWDLKISGLDSIPSFSLGVANPCNLIVKTAITEKMLDRGFLAGPLFYPSICHSDSEISRYANELGSVVGEIEFAFQQDKLDSLVAGELAHSGFQRLN